jgi:hypothetical protein
MTSPIGAIPLLTTRSSDLVAAKAARRNGSGHQNGSSSHLNSHAKSKSGKPSAAAYISRRKALEKTDQDEERDLGLDDPETEHPAPEDPETEDPDARTINVFECYKPKLPTNFPEPPKEVPVVDTLPELVAWTDTFVHRIGELVLREQRVS